MSWFAHYHYLFVHFPIALIIMAGVAELLMILKKESPLDPSVNFLLIAAALLLVPTIATGLFLKEIEAISPANQTYLEWHETLAFMTLSLTIMTLALRYRFRRHPVYFISLILLIVSVTLTAHFGGTMAFGPINYLPRSFYG